MISIIFHGFIRYIWKNRNYKISKNKWHFGSGRIEGKIWAKNTKGRVRISRRYFVLSTRSIPSRYIAVLYWWSLEKTRSIFETRMFLQQKKFRRSDYGGHEHLTKSITATCLNGNIDTVLKINIYFFVKHVYS